MVWVSVAERPSEVTHRTAVIAVRARAEVGTIARIVAVFEMRGLDLNYMSCQRVGTYLLIDVEVTTGDNGLDEVILHRLRNLACVDRATFLEK